MSKFARTTLTSATFTILLLFALPAAAKSVQDFNAMTPADQSEYLVSFLEKMVGDISQKSPKLGRDIKNFFFHNAKDKQFSEGIRNIYVELTAIELRAREGKADLSKIQLESIVVYVVKQKFPPPWTDETKAGSNTGKTNPPASTSAPSKN